MPSDLPKILGPSLGASQILLILRKPGSEKQHREKGSSSCMWGVALIWTPKVGKTVGEDP